MFRRGIVLGLFLLLGIFSVGCGSKSREGYSVAVDPSFFPLNIQGREENVYVFINDLLHDLGKREGISFSKVNVAWDMVLSMIDHEKYDAAVSSLMPYLYNESKYEFSDVLLPTGPVLIVRERSNVNSLSDMSKGLLLVPSDDDAQMIMEKYPDMLTQRYDMPATVFEKVLNGYADGMLLESIDAIAYVNDLYAKRLRIAEGPFGSSGLRIITKKGENVSLIQKVNSGLESLKADGSYDALAKKWRVK